MNFLATKEAFSRRTTTLNIQLAQSHIRFIAQAMAFALLMQQYGHAQIGDEDWPRFRGPNGTGISLATTVPRNWTEDDYNWVIDLPGTGHGSPVIVGTNLFLLCGEPETATRAVVCVNVASGQLRWQRDFPSQSHHLHDSNSYGSGTPVADEDGVVVTWADPDKLTLMALNNEGKIVWQRDLGPYYAINGSGNSPIIVDDLVILTNIQTDPNFFVSVGILPESMAEDPNDSSLIAVDRKTGKTRWEIERKTFLASYATPCVRELDNGEKEVIVIDSGYGVTGVDPMNGRINWQTDNLLPSRTVASPVLAGDLVFASYGSGVTGDVFFAVRAGNPPEVAYERRKSVPLTPTPIVKDDQAFLWSDAGIVTCMKAATGDVIWQKRVGGNFYGSPVWVDGYLYCVNRRGSMVVIDTAEKNGQTNTVSLGEPSFATPAVAGGVMYIRTETQLLSLGGTQQDVPE